jgi:hypothetical protein
LGLRVLLDIYGYDLGQFQLLVEKLDDAPQLRRDAVRHEDQPQGPLL